MSIKYNCNKAVDFPPLHLYCFRWRDIFGNIRTLQTRAISEDAARWIFAMSMNIPKDDIDSMGDSVGGIQITKSKEIGNQFKACDWIDIYKRIFANFEHVKAWLLIKNSIPIDINVSRIEAALDDFRLMLQVHVGKQIKPCDCTPLDPRCDCGKYGNSRKSVAENDDPFNVKPW